MSPAVLVGGQTVAAPGVQAEVGEPPAALVAEQALRVLVEHAEQAMAVPLPQVHGPSMRRLDEAG